MQEEIKTVTITSANFLSELNKSRLEGIVTINSIYMTSNYHLTIQSY